MAFDEHFAKDFKVRKNKIMCWHFSTACLHIVHFKATLNVSIICETLRGKFLHIFLILFLHFIISKNTIDYYIE